MQNSGYYKNVNYDLFANIPQSSKSILEFGCGAGYLGAAYKLHNPSVHYAGVEYVQEEAESAKNFLDQVVCGDIEDTALVIPKAETEFFDCLVYGDVLEHLKDPWKCLSRHLQLLSQDGVVVACIPNVQHWSTLANLLQGQWPTVDHGLFDRTHLRWFTRDSIIQWFKSNELQIYGIQSRVFAPDQAKDFAIKMLPALQNLGLDPQKVFEGIAPLQYVITAGKVSRQLILVEGFSSLSPDSMAEVRLSQPLRALASRPMVNVGLYMHEMKLTHSHLMQQKILIWQRPIFRPTEQDFQKLRLLIRNGYVVVIDWDDDPDHWPVLKQDDYITFKMVHAVQVSRPELAERISKWNSNIKVFPNMLEKLPVVDRDNKKDGHSGLKMFFGALNRDKDWAPFIKDLNHIFRPDPNFWSASVIHDRAFFDALDLPEGRKTFRPLCSHADYLNEMSACDFAFLPLLDIPFNHLKSDLKMIEAASCGLASLASKVVYGETIQHGVNGELFGSSSEMTACLKAWRIDPQKVASLGQAANQWVREHRMAAYQVQDRENWYRQLICDQKELTRQLIERVPQLQEPSIS